MTRALIVGITFGCMAGAAVLSVIWFVAVPGTSRFEPAVQTLGLLAGITGIFAERLAAARERRNQAVTAVADELAKNRAILDGSFALAGAPGRPVGAAGRPVGAAGRPVGRADAVRVYPRLLQSAVDYVLVSGVLAESGDRELVRLLHEWRDTVREFNHRLDLTELRIFVGSAQDEASEFDQALRHAGGYLSRVHALLDALAGHLRRRYADLVGTGPAPPTATAGS
jgi:hypothetical protein